MPGAGRGRLPVVLDLETGDPDDVLTLILAACHPRVDLRAVTVTPGGRDQLVLMKWVLGQLGVRNVRLGARAWPDNAKCKGFSETAYTKLLGRGRISAALSDAEVSPAGALIAEVCAEHADATLFTGAALHNLGAALELGAKIPRWVGQGGFCGVGVVPDTAPTLPAFAGRRFYPTFNFGGNREAAEAALASKSIGRRVLVGKNVCHRCEHGAKDQARLGAAIRSMPRGPHVEALRCT